MELSKEEFNKRIRVEIAKVTGGWVISDDLKSEYKLYLKVAEGLLDDWEVQTYIEKMFPFLRTSRRGVIAELVGDVYLDEQE